jgi:hypothetical protein
VVSGRSQPSEHHSDLESKSIDVAALFAERLQRFHVEEKGEEGRETASYQQLLRQGSRRKRRRGGDKKQSSELFRSNSENNNQESGEEEAIQGKPSTVA